MTPLHRIYIGDGGIRPVGFDFYLNLEEHIYTAREQFRETFGTLNSLESDLLQIGSAIFAIDRGIARGEREDFARRFEVSLPVVNVAKLQPLLPTIEKVLRTLSDDSWRLSLRQQVGMPEETEHFANSEGRTLLFSGGLDSLAAAVEFGGSSDLHLVSHVTRNQETRNTQKKLVGLLKTAGFDLPHHQFFVSSKDAQNFDHDVEGSQRTRSFLFLILGALVARRCGHHQLLMMAENGQLAIHLPLSQARIGAFSTHTAHPDVLVTMQQFLQEALCMPFKIINPYVYRTKGEVISVVWTKLQNAIFVSNSCWKNARLTGNANHCGECIPCYVRRIAIETHGTDQTAYARNIFAEDIASLPATDEGRRNMVDLCEFSLLFQQQPEIELMSEWPELYSRNIEAAQAIQMYKRAAEQTLTVLSRYRGVASILQ
jgi:7-cyano-7-deazaguanine synthase in queuosine biosynthesis